jgi:hypothetical protein
LVAVPLRADVKSPLAARNDAENPAVDTDTHADKKADGKPVDKPAAPANVDVDLDRFEARAVVLPPKSGTYADLQAVKGKLLYRRAPRAGSHDEKSAIVFFDLDAREEKTVVEVKENTSSTTRACTASTGTR